MGFRLRAGGEGEGWVSVCARKRERDGGGFMGGMVARGVEGMGPRIREETDWGAGQREGGTPIPSFPHEGGRKGIGEGREGWVPACARTRIGERREQREGGAGTAGGWGVFMGEMVARGVEGMGPRIREETGGGRGGFHGGDGSRGGGFWAMGCWQWGEGAGLKPAPTTTDWGKGGRGTGAHEGRPYGGREESGGGWVPAFARTRRGRDGSPHSRGHGLGSVGNNGRGARGGGRGFRVRAGREGRGMGPRIREETGGGRGNGGGLGVMGGMVTRGGMGCRVRAGREETGGGRGNGGGLGVEGVFMGGMVTRGGMGFRVRAGREGRGMGFRVREETGGGEEGGWIPAFAGMTEGGMGETDGRRRRGVTYQRDSSLRSE